MFGLIHVLIFLFSVLLWLLLAAWNTRAAAWSMGYSSVGLLNFTAYMAYVTSALTLGHLGDRLGYKRPLAYSFLAFACVLPLGFFWTAPWTLFLTACLVLVFFGHFYPSMEGLLSRMEAREGVHPYSTTARFSLAWSSGNIVGMLFGPWLIQRMPGAVFAGGIALCLAGAAALAVHWRRFGEGLPKPRTTAFSGIEAPHFDGPRLQRLRLGARAALLCGSLAFVGAMLLYPKLLSAAGVPLSKVGFITAFGNLGVFAAFLILLPTRFWIGRPGLCAAISGGLLLVYGAALFSARTPALFALAVVLGGFAYAVPYTFALFYGLHTPDADNARQGGIHEALIGLSQGFGPLAAGLLLGAGAGTEGLGLAIIALALLSGGLQVLFAGSFRRIKASRL
jgi:MFS family permease